MIQAIDRLIRRVAFQDPTLRNQLVQRLDRETFSTFIQARCGDPPIQHPFLSVFRARMMNQVVENAAPELCIVLFQQA